jgi:hypothetical protein
LGGQFIAVLENTLAAADSIRCGGKDDAFARPCRPNGKCVAVSRQGRDSLINHALLIWPQNHDYLAQAGIGLELAAGCGCDVPQAGADVCVGAGWPEAQGEAAGAWAVAPALYSFMLGVMTD